MNNQTKWTLAAAIVWFALAAMSTVNVLFLHPEHLGIKISLTVCYWSSCIVYGVIFVNKMRNPDG